MNSYLVPANSKKGLLIFSLFKPFDVILFGTGLLISLLLLAMMPSTTDTLTMVLIASPGIICGLLVMPVPNYHNVRTAIMSIYKFYTGRRRYIWKGWCFYERFLEEYKAETKK